MKSRSVAADNPLVRLARACPSVAGAPLTLGARIAGGALAIGIAADQTYDRTRALAAFVAVVALASCIPIGGRLREKAPWIGAGVLFFGGALLLHLTAGVVVLLCGALAGAGAAIREQQGERSTHIFSFFIAFGLIALAVAAIVVGIEG